jgi:hypothetical protein
LVLCDSSFDHSFSIGRAMQLFAKLMATNRTTPKEITTTKKKEKLTSEMEHFAIHLTFLHILTKMSDGTSPD